MALVAGMLVGCNKDQNSTSLEDSRTSTSTELSVSTGDQSTPTEKVVTGIEIGNYPTKTEYDVGDTLDLSGLTIIVYYSDGTDDEITATMEMVKTMPDLSSAGEKKVVLMYEGFETDYKIQVKGEKIQPTISFTIESGSKFYLDEAPLIDALVDPSDAEYSTHYTNADDENLGDTMPTEPGAYSFVCEVVENDKYLANKAWVTFTLLEKNDKVTPTFSFTYLKDDVETPLENGTHFVEGKVPTFTAKADQADAEVEVFYTKDDGATNLGSEAPTTEGTYAINIKSVENEQYNESSAFRWYVIDKAPDVDQTAVHLVGDEVAFTYDGQPHTPVWHFENDENERVDDVQYTAHYSSDDTGYNSDQAPTAAAWYSISITITDERYVLSGASWIVFHIDSPKTTLTPTVTFTFESGDTFYYDGTGEKPLIDVLVEPDTVTYKTYFEQEVDGKQVNLGTEIPTEPGTYSFICETDANGEYEATRNWKWFRIAAPINA